MNYFKQCINEKIEITLINGDREDGIIRYLCLEKKILFLENIHNILLINIDKIKNFRIKKNINKELFSWEELEKNMIKNNIDVIPLTENKKIIKLYEKLYKIFPYETKWSGKNLIFGEIILAPPYIFDKKAIKIDNNYHLSMFEKNYNELFNN